ncbi:Cna B-type domain-containing protein [Catenibacterium sp. AM22-15]|uniref:Cna B-type domain-containing protein n=2 Tax=Catenibacterium TaxID=135858 RepID=UPI000E3F2F9F|nr:MULTISPECIES: Cna B-type domain-containing protein [unclassified Catenibacterium]RGE97771.1 Cna B-type domain-containing protein [Catenibacterium sp. AM22-6LB]RGF05736.1 Cna B-type domain-containing protein [Catenibacterium sp. AM22-15]
MNKIKIILNKWVLLILCIALVCTQANAAGIVNFDSPDNTSQETVYDNNTNTTETTENIETYYQNDKICIYNYNQLKQIGSDAYVYTGDKDGSIGSGEVVKNEGTELRYTSDAQYVLMSDIEMSTDYIWTLPNNFTGSITGTTRESTSLYNKETDTITIYNPYQLMVLAQDNSETEPVMSLDYDAPQFGMGQMIYPNGENQPYLTYSKTHKYVLSQSFDSSKRKLVENQLRESSSSSVQWLNGEHADGRTKPGQLYTEVGGKKYILIGNESQLRAIGTNKNVTPRLYVHYTQGLVSGLLGGKPFYTPYYPGDADLGLDAVAKEGATTHLEGFSYKPDTIKGDNSYLYYKDNGKYKLADINLTSDDVVTGLLKGVGGLLGTLLGGLTVGTGSLCGVNDEGLPDSKNASLTKLKAEYGNLKYSSNANYIIFRDIDLSKDGVNSNKEDDLWTPLMVSGNIIGAKLANGQQLLTDGNSIFATGKPIISNVNVNQTEKMDSTKYIGVGFFGTVTNEINVNNVGVSAGRVTVSNLELRNVDVKNNTNEHKNTQTLISGLTSGLGWLVGGVVDLLVGVLSFGKVKLNLKDTLSALLNARAKDPTIYATGAFAGRLVGDVSIENCDVTGKVSVSNINGRTGGFVGYTEGVTQYDGLSKVLGVTVNALSSLLNAIPGLGLGDLITILLDNALPVGNLIPTGYKNVIIKNCHLNNLTGIIGNDDKDFAGGFVGQQVGTDIFDCSINNSNYTVKAKEYGGGFAGISRDADIKGTLSDVGVELIRVTQPQSLLMNCNILNCDVTVSGENYQGGMTGALTNSYAINCGSTGSISVKATGSYAGGVAGIATVGWVTNLGKDEVSDPSLLKTVGKLLTDLLSSDPEKAGMLLSLTGIAPSAILGCNMNCSSISVEAGKSYAGGILGGGDGVYLAESSQEYLSKLSYWKYGALQTESVAQRDNTINGLLKVKAGENRVGGIAGSVTTASVTGLLNNTLGVGNFLGFTVHNVTVNGKDGYTVEAGHNYAGGALGEAIGGDVDTVTLSNIKSITAKNRTGGFVGCAGPGDLVGGNGLTLNLLGLNNLLKVGNLLSVAEGIRVKINNTHANGIKDGFTVKATGTNNLGEVVDYTAGGFIGKSNSCEINHSDVKNLKEVSANDSDGIAGGFIGSSQTGGLADVANEADIKALLNVNGLLGAIKYLVPSYTVCTVTYVNGGGVSADTAGGFAGSFQSGTVNNYNAGQGNYYSVYNIDHVNGQSYAGGFGGNVYSGALADAGKGISILGGIKGLDIKIGDLLNVINAYIPYVRYAGVKSDSGFTVIANKLKTDDTHAGSAGGFIGYGSGVQVSYCDVTYLKHTNVTPPKDLEATEAPTYFDNNSQYAVTGARYAGGYIGYMDIGSAASVGKGLSVLGKSIGINNVLDALNVVVSTIEHSHVTGNPGGFAVKASYENTASDASENDVLGDAGGFAGKISGGHIQDSNANNFSYIIGQLTAGGYVGDLQPGNVANVLGNASILKGLVDVKSALASVAEDFVPTIRNSSTTCIPCGGAVRAQASSTTQVQRGLAGGYVGHNEGGHIWGNNTKKWKGQDYSGPTSTCKAVRIRSVYGEEIAGGFTGLMESADTASTGNLSLLWGLVKVDNILGALSVVYPTEENTAVYGPLAQMDYKSWNDWVEFVGKYKGYGSDLAENGKVNSQEQLDKIIGKYIYGYNVVAGRENYRDEIKLANGGAAGGYVGSMQTGKITNGQAYQAKTIKGLRCAGGFVGEMINGGAADLGGVNILGLDLQLGRMIDVLNVFVPVIKQSSVEGYQSGLIVQSEGVDDKDTCGYAGGYVGKLIGGQIWGDNTAHCQVKKLRRVDGRSYVGGFVGSSRPGSVATLNPNAGEGLLSKLLNKLLSSPSDLIKVLNATVATINYADVESWDDWGFIVNGAYTTGNKNTSYAKTAGGFAGMLEGTVLGKKDKQEAGISVKNIRSVIAGEYAGGCFGVADVAGVANISAGDESSLLDKLLKLGRTDVLDAFRSYLYYGNVIGSKDAGLSVSANKAIKSGQNNQVTYSGTAGGFGGSLLNGSVKNSTVTQLSNVRGLNSVGGFVGYSGKSGVVKADKIDVIGDNTGQLLGGALGVMDIFGSHIDECSVSGTSDGYTVQSQNGEEQIAGGFIGYANLARMSKCTAGSNSDLNIGLKQVASGGTAGGFAGRTSFAYLADLKLDSGPVNVIFAVVNQLVKALYLDKIQDSNLLKINLGIIKVEALYKGKLLHVNLLGLDISVGLSKKSTDNSQQTDLAIITIGDSSIKLPCDENGLLNDNDAKSNISVSLIKANRTKITDSKVYGVSYGYDIYAGGATNNNDGTSNDGRSGGFVGFNDEGLLKNNDMYYCDVVRGTKNLVGPFSGKSELDSVYEFNTLDKVEGEGNNYRIYRKLDKSLTEIKNNSQILNSSYEKNGGWDIYTIQHMITVKAFDKLKNAVLASKSDSVKADLKAYESSAKAVLMADTKTTLNTGESETPEPSESQDPCDKHVKLTINKVWKDFDNFDNKRPESITVTISRTWKDANGNKTETVPGYESYTITGSIKKSTWQEVIKGLPAYIKESDGTVCYYKYSVTEAEINGYTTTINTSEDGFTFTITNKHFPCLPGTGGSGNYLYYTIAILLFLVYFVMRYRKNKENKAEKL